LPTQITTDGLARVLVQADGGPMPDAPRVGPALRQLGFRRARCRRGALRPTVWLHLAPLLGGLGDLAGIYFYWSTLD